MVYPWERRAIVAGLACAWGLVAVIIGALLWAFTGVWAAFMIFSLATGTAFIITLACATKAVLVEMRKEAMGEGEL